VNQKYSGTLLNSAKPLCLYDDDDNDDDDDDDDGDYERNNITVGATPRTAARNVRH